jgi:tetratricopeptide (TPR) repeat protein
LLGTAATIGRSFNFDTLHEASGRSEEETVTGLEELISQGLVEEIRNIDGERGMQFAQRRHSRDAEHSPVYDFCHEKLRNLVYEEITLARRRLLHRRTAEALVTRLRGQREIDTFASQIARHYQLAGNSEAAAQYFLQAGEYARGLYAPTEALAHFQNALDLQYPNSAYLHEAIGDLHTFLGAYEAALKSYKAAQIPDMSRRTEALLLHKQGKVYERRGNWTEAEKYFAQALALLDQQSSNAEDIHDTEETYREEQAYIYVDWSLSAHHREQIEQALNLAQRALELAEGSHDTRALAQAHNMLGILANSGGDIQKASFHLEHSLVLAESLQDASIRAAALNNLALACKAHGDIPRAITLTETALALCSSQGDRHREAALHSNLADLFHATGQSDEAMSQLKLAARIYTEIDVEAGAMQPEIWKLVEW